MFLLLSFSFGNISLPLPRLLLRLYSLTYASLSLQSKMSKGVESLFFLQGTWEKDQQWINSGLTHLPQMGRRVELLFCLANPTSFQLVSVRGMTVGQLVQLVLFPRGE